LQTIFLKILDMGRDDLIRYVEEQLNTKPDFPEFRAGDTITVHYKIKEGNKERIQQFQGVVIQIKGKGLNKTFTVRKISNNVGVERIFPFTDPFIAKIEVNKRGRVRRARIYYFRKLRGKKAKIKERRIVS
jgi:large subunit ribosomal protein L19